jgi:hypothetical protein
MRRAESSGVHTLRPFAIPLETTRAETDYLIRQTGARNFEKRNALRFYVPGDKIPNVATWFRSRRMYKDPDIARQMQSRLTELRIVTRRDMKGMQATWRGVAAPHEARSTREGVTDSVRRTSYLAYVWDITVPAGVLGLLTYTANLHHSPVYFATWHEIQAGMTTGATHVSSLSQALFAPAHRHRAHGCLTLKTTL